MLPKHTIANGCGHFCGAAIEEIDGSLHSRNCAHGLPIQQTNLHCTRKLVGTQVEQNHLRMKTLGDQVREFRELMGWDVQTMALAVGTSRQNIESLEKSGNRIPKYLGALAVVMQQSVDQLLATAGLLPGDLVPTERGPLSTNYSAEERALMENFRALPDEDQALVFADIEHRATKTLAHVEKVLSRMGIDKNNSQFRGGPGYATNPVSAVRIPLSAVSLEKSSTIKTPALDRMDAELSGAQGHERNKNQTSRKPKSNRRA